MLELTKGNFDKVIDENEIVIIDFWANWCQPCLSFADTYSRVAADFPGLCFSKVNVEEETELANDFGVRSIPTLIVIKSRVVIFSESGTMPEDIFRDLIEQAIQCEVDANPE